MHEDLLEEGETFSLNRVARLMAKEREPTAVDCKPCAWIASSLAIRRHRQSQII